MGGHESSGHLLDGGERLSAGLLYFWNTCLNTRWAPTFPKVNEYYTSIDAFELFAKLTAIGILAITIMRKASRESNPSEYIAPWVALASRLGFDQLADAIVAAEPQKWRAEAMAARAQSEADTAATQSGLSGGWIDDIEMHIQSWFAERVEPLLRAQRELAVRKVRTGSQASAQHNDEAPEAGGVLPWNKFVQIFSWPSALRNAFMRFISWPSALVEWAKSTRSESELLKEPLR